VRLGVRRIDGQRSLKMGSRLVQLCSGHEQRAEVVVGVRVVGRDPQSLAILVDGLRPSPRRHQRRAEIEVRDRDIGRQPRGRGKMVDGLAGAPNRKIEERDVVMKRDVARRPPQSRFALRMSSRNTSGLDSRRAGRDRPATA
jgi:hypothetical protein